MNYINSLRSEWLKTKGSTAFWLCLAGGLFIPVIYFIAALVEWEAFGGTNFWVGLFGKAWVNMASFLLPMGVILASSLITQMEFKNNTWKQVHASPQSYLTIFSAKFTVIMLMTGLFFLYFSVGLIAAVLGANAIIGTGEINESFPFWEILKITAKFFLMSLPILGFQFLLSLKFKNFLVSVGIGLLGVIGTLIGMSWEHLYVSPYSYLTMLAVPIPRDFSIIQYGLIYFAILMTGGFFLYRYKREKG